MRFFVRGPIALDVVDQRLAKAARPAKEVGKRTLLRRGQPARFIIAAEGDDVDAYHRVWIVKLLGRFEAAAVDSEAPGSAVRARNTKRRHGSSSSAAGLAPKSLDPRIHNGTSVPAAGTA